MVAPIVDLGQVERIILFDRIPGTPDSKIDTLEQSLKTLVERMKKDGVLSARLGRRTPVAISDFLRANEYEFALYFRFRDAKAVEEFGHNQVHTAWADDYYRNIRAPSFAIFHHDI